MKRPVTHQCHSCSDNAMSQPATRPARSSVAYTINNGAIMAVAFQGTLYGQQIMTTFHYRYEGPVIASGQTFLQTFIGVNAQMQANQGLWRACISADCVSLEAAGQWIWPLRYRAYRVPMAGPTGDMGSANASNTASVITLIADEATRHGVGNKHLPGLAGGNQDQGFLTNPQIVANTDFSTAMATSVPLLGGVMQPVIYNRANPAASLDVVGAEVNQTVRVMRRRTVGLGK